MSTFVRPLLLMSAPLAAAVAAMASAQDRPVETLGASPPATASTEQSSSDPTVSNISATADDERDVIVTGSRIRRDGFQSPTPVTVASRDQLTAAAPSSIPDALNQLPQFQLSSKPSSAGPSANNNAGGNFLNLRALGVSRTLILIDGRRAVPSNASSATDVNLIPQALVSRVEVVTGGASAAYGSDAVAGVVNFVLDTRYTGLKGEVQGGISRYDDDKSYKVNLTGGGALTDRGHIVFSVERAERDGFQTPNGRKWAEASYGPISSASGRPTTLITRDATISNATYGGLVTSGPFANQQFLPGGGLAPFAFGTERTATTMIGGDGVRDIAGLPTSLNYTTSFVHARYAVTDHIEVFAQASFGSSHTRFLSTNFNTSGTSAFRVYQDNPFLPAALQTQLRMANVPFVTLGRIDRDFVRPNFDVKNQSLDLVGGITVDLGGGWRADGYYEHGRTVQRIETRSNPIYERVYRAADAVAGPGGRTVCRSTLTNPTDGCVPLNVLGEGSPSAAAIAYITGTSASRQVVKQDVVNGQVSGEPFTLPGGPVSLTVGGEYRRVTTSQVSDAISQSTITDTSIRGLPTTLVGKLGGFYLTNPQPSAGRYTISEGFAEAVVPILKGVPLAELLELNAAARYTHYSLSGGVTTWKGGLTWQPVTDLRVRATRSRDIRAGNFGELFAGTTQSQGLLRDPLAGNAQVRFFSRRAGNPGLTPERADTLTFGFVYSPAFVPGLSLSVDGFKIDIKDAIALPSPQDVVNACAAGATEQCALISRDTGGVLQAVITPYQNAAQVRTAGFDTEVAYRRAVGSGNATARLLTSTIFRNVTTLRGAAPLDRAGDYGNSVAAITNGVPRVTGTLSLAWDNEALGIFAQERFISAGKYDHTLIEGIGINDNSIPAVFYTDVTARYRFKAAGRKVELFTTLNNLFDRAPPPAPSVTTATFYPTNTFIYDLTGRYYTVGLRFEF